MSFSYYCQDPDPTVNGGRSWIAPPRECDCTPGGCIGTCGKCGPCGLPPLWNLGLEGGRGPAGPQGATGPTGPSGTTGLDGPGGPRGATGPSGPSGTTGPEGVQGPTGSLMLTNRTSRDGSFAVGRDGLFIPGIQPGELPPLARWASWFAARLPYTCDDVERGEGGERVERQKVYVRAHIITTQPTWVNITWPTPVDASLPLGFRADPTVVNTKIIPVYWHERGLYINSQMVWKLDYYAE